MANTDTPIPWNNECEVCYGKHPFKDGETFFHILHPFSPDEPINVCQICWFRSEGKLISKHTFCLSHSIVS
jgi:hypothetical protein